MPGEETYDDMVAESALQLWAAAQTDFDPFQVDHREWPEVQVPVWDADIATDARLDLETVRAALGRLDGTRLVVDQSGDTWAVTSVIPEDRPL